MSPLAAIANRRIWQGIPRSLRRCSIVVLSASRDENLLLHRLGLESFFTSP